MTLEEFLNEKKEAEIKELHQMKLNPVLMSVQIYAPRRWDQNCVSYESNNQMNLKNNIQI